MLIMLFVTHFRLCSLKVRNLKWSMCTHFNYVFGKVKIRQSQKTCDLINWGWVQEQKVKNHLRKKFPVNKKKIMQDINKT